MTFIISIYPKFGGFVRLCHIYKLVGDNISSNPKYKNITVLGNLNILLIG